jgi:hypothetical protein
MSGLSFMTFMWQNDINVINDRPGINKCQVQMSHDGCLEKAMTLRKTGWGGKVVLKNVFKEKMWKNSFGHFSLYKFSKLIEILCIWTKGCFCKLGKILTQNKKVFVIESAYICVLHPILGEHICHVNFVTIQLTLDALHMVGVCPIQHKMFSRSPNLTLSP